MTIWKSNKETPEDLSYVCFIHECYLYTGKFYKEGKIIYRDTRNVNGNILLRNIDMWCDMYDLICQAREEFKL